MKVSDNSLMSGADNPFFQTGDDNNVSKDQIKFLGGETENPLGLRALLKKNNKSDGAKDVQLAIGKNLR